MTRLPRVRRLVRVVVPPVLAVLLVPASIALAQSESNSQVLPEPELSGPATDWSDRIPAHLSVVDGVAELERDGRVDPAEENLPLLAGDRVRTGTDGRVEILFADGSALDLDYDTDVTLLSDTLLRVDAGRLGLLIARGTSGFSYRIDAASTSTWIRTAGEYRLEVTGRPSAPDVRVGVLRGSAELVSPIGRTVVRAGTEAHASAAVAPSLPYALNVSLRDDFDRWVRDQHDYRVGRASARYLPAELQHYGGAFDRDGRWEHTQGYGYVWYPHVAPGWQPYYVGGWSFVASFGWTWVGSGGRWTWPTHHYGRWGLYSGRWFWIPGRRWGPAWVSWATAPGYISWTPLGFDNRPVIAVTNINVFGGSSPRWATVRANVLVTGSGPRRHVVRTRTVYPPSGTRFTLRGEVPVRPALLSTRRVEPISAPTTPGTRYAIPRPAFATPPARLDARTPAPAATSRAASSGSRLVAAPTARPADRRPDGVAGTPRARPRSAAPLRGQAPVLRTAPPLDQGDRPPAYRLVNPRRATDAPAPASGTSRTRVGPSRAAPPVVSPSSRPPAGRPRVESRPSRAPLPSPVPPGGRAVRERGNEAAPARVASPRAAPRPSAPPTAERTRPERPSQGPQAPANRGRAQGRERR